MTGLHARPRPHWQRWTWVVALWMLSPAIGAGLVYLAVHMGWVSAWAGPRRSTFFTSCIRRAMTLRMH